ncbi:MAG: hypothetical protein M0026_00400 [Nocardiopsaceae bacterium]|nr:hypothetical protein [Nocardiopsaceae bacterium]
MFRRQLSHLPVRLVSGMFILNSGLNKLSADEQAATGMQEMAAGTYPFLKKVDAPTFARLLAGTEIGIGAALLLPVVPASVAGAALTAFSGGLLGMYLRTPGMHQKLRPTEQGTSMAKDAWLLGIGTSLVIDGLVTGRKKKKKR